MLRTAPLNEGEFDAAGRRRDADPQRGGRGVARAGLRPHQAEQGFAGLRCEVQATQGVIADVLLPKQDGAAGPGT